MKDSHFAQMQRFRLAKLFIQVAGENKCVLDMSRENW